MNEQPGHAEPASRALRSRIPPRAAGRRLLDYLVERYRYLDTAAWQRELAAGRIELDGVLAAQGTVLRAGAQLCWHKQQHEPFADTNFTLLHQDASLVVVDKPAHLTMHADGPFVHQTLVQLLRQRLRAPDLQLVHRLDRETSGVCVVAATAAARRHLHEQFAASAVRKVYRAVVHGHVATAFIATAPIGRATASSIALRRAAGEHASAAAPAETRFWPEAHGPGVTLLRCEPTTGRTHQIRVHLEANGTPVLGDKLYGHPDAHYLEFVARVKRDGDARHVAAGEPDRQLLHASELTLLHPDTGAHCTFTAPLPSAFAAWLARGCTQ